MRPPPADWQLPPGVSREVWDYLHDSTLARRYDESLAGTPLLDLDQRFVARHCPTPGRLIDLGCGTGRVAVPLARLGHRVTAVDLSEDGDRFIRRTALARRGPEGEVVPSFPLALCAWAEDKPYRWDPESSSPSRWMSGCSSSSPFWAWAWWRC